MIPLGPEEESARVADGAGSIFLLDSIQRTSELV